MHPHGAQWNPNPQPSRTNVTAPPTGCCDRTGENGEACALIENDDASTPQVRTNDNLPNIDETPLLAAFLGHCVVLLKTEAHAVDLVTEPGLFAWAFCADGLFLHASAADTGGWVVSPMGKSIACT